MSKLSRLQDKLVKVNTRLAEIEGIYSTIVKVKSYEHGIAGQRTAYQDFGAVGLEYRKLCDRQESLEDRIDSLSGNDNGNTTVAFTKL